MNNHRMSPKIHRLVPHGRIVDVLALGVLAMVMVGAAGAAAAQGQSNASQAAAVQPPSPSPTPLPAVEARQELDQARLKIQDLQVQVIQLKERLRAALQWKLVRQLEEEVSKIRGLPLRHHVTMETIDRAQTQQLIQRLISKDMPSSVAIPDERTLILLGALPPATNLRQTLVNLFAEQVGGLYDDTTKKLYVTSQFDPESPIGKVILAHEICHALQDQNFDLSRYPLHITDDDDRAYAASSVLEGDATVLMMNYMMENLSLSWLFDLPKALSIDQAQFNAAPPYLQYLLVFPYLEGMNLIMTAEATAPDARNALLRNPPLSTEQVIHPEKYFNRADYDAPIPVEAADLSSVLGKGWSVKGQNTYGEEGIRAILMHNEPVRLNYFSTKPLAVDPKIAQAAAGWGGDRVAIWLKEAPTPQVNTGGNTGTAAEKTDAPSDEINAPVVLEWRTVWDTNRDADEFRTYAIGTWLPSILPGAKDFAPQGMENARAWTANGGEWARIQWSGNQVDLLIGLGKGSEKMLTAPTPDARIPRKD